MRQEREGSVPSPASDSVCHELLNEWLDFCVLLLHAFIVELFSVFTADEKQKVRSGVQEALRDDHCPHPCPRWLPCFMILGTELCPVTLGALTACRLQPFPCPACPRGGSEARREVLPSRPLSFPPGFPQPSTWGRGGAGNAQICRRVSHCSRSHES